MKTFSRLEDWLSFRATLGGRSVGFVPTMGALHQGHLTLMKKARAENDFVLASIFVNPTQFNNKEDLEKYPRTLEADLAALASVGVDGVILPTEEQMYRDGYRYRVTESTNGEILCGATRPGHFDGVLTVVMKLLGLAQPRRCYMGEKDFQQFRLVQEMAEAFFLATEIVPVETVREESGLAMSSRNERLSQAARAKAALIYKYLNEAKTAEDARHALQVQGFDVDYVEEHWGRRFAAAKIENVRLIDNVAL